jgi:hypothetical protein
MRPLRPEFQAFAEAMQDKFDEAIHKDKERSPRPWLHYTKTWLNSRLHDEVKEWDEAYSGPMGVRKDFPEAQTELLDIANFAMFLWHTVEHEGP